MNTVLHYANMALQAQLAQGKKGMLVPDSEGYYTVVVGALNYVSEAGEIWVAEGVTELFDRSSVLLNRVSRGQLYAEDGHTKLERGMSQEDYISALAQNDQDRFVGQVRDIWLDYDLAATLPGVNDDAIIKLAKIIPYGAREKVLADSISNPHMDTCFSVRGLSFNKTMQGKTYRKLYNIFKYDLVPSPGHRIASKYMSPAIENRVFFSKDEVAAVYNALDIDINSPIALEDKKAQLGSVLASFDKDHKLSEEIMGLSNRSAALTW